MGYLNETGLATLVGKVKGQVVQLTSAEYQQIPAETKNYDNKLYLVEDEAYAYPVDNEPTLNSKNLVKSGGVYKYTSKVGTGTLTTTAKTLIPAVNELYNSLSNKFRVVTSGSLRDIKNAGIYYLTSGVTDKPVNSGGIYYCGFYGDTVYGGIFAPTYEGTATQLYLTFTNNGSTWNTYSIGTKKFETVTVISDNKTRIRISEKYV